MHRRTRLGMIFSVALTAACTPAMAQPGGSGAEFPPPALTKEQASSYTWPEELPEASAVFARHLEAAGGEDAIRRRTTRYLRGSMINEETGLRAILTAYQQAPNMLQIDINRPGASRQVITFDGEFAWATFDGGTPVLLGGATLRDIGFSSFFYRIADWKARFGQVKTQDFGVVAGRPCVRVQFASPSGKVGYVCFDVETGLHHATITATGGTTGQDGLSQQVISEYRLIDGLLVATKVAQRTADGVTVTAYTTISHDVGEMPSFEQPDEIKRRIADIKAAQPEPGAASGAEDEG